MISKEEIKKLADLARIEIGEEEAEKLSGEMDAILGYVKSLQGFHPEANFPQGNIDEGEGVNIFRADENPNESGAYSNELIAEFPKKENNYLKVKKIL